MTRKLLFVATLLCICSQAWANRIMGTDIRFLSLGSGNYEIEIKLYRDCTEDSITDISDDVKCYLGNNGSLDIFVQSLKMTRIAINDVSRDCAKSPKACDPQNTSGSKFGIEEHIFTVTIDISKYPFPDFGLGSAYCELTIALGTFGRNQGVTNIASSTLWTRGTMDVCNLNRCAKKENTTPEFGSKAVFPCFLNMAVLHNFQAVDTIDFDSMDYRLVPALTNLSGASATYNSPFTYQYPVTPYCVPPTTIKCIPNTKTNPPRGFFFDTALGQIIYTPISKDEKSVFVTLVSEFRKDTSGKWLRISYVRREQQIVVDTMTYNKAPVIDGPVLNQICEGDKICFDIMGKDETFTPYQTVPDTVQLRWNTGIPGATFTVKNPMDREKTAEFCWQTKVGLASDVAYSFTVTATDDHCPKPAYSIRGFKVKVNQRALGERKYTRLKNDSFAFEAKIPGNFKGVAQYKWSLRDSSGTEFFYSTKRTDTVPCPKDTFFIVFVINNSDNCPTMYIDTVSCSVTSSVKEISPAAISIHPNPVRIGEFLQVSGLEKAAFELVDAKGSSILKGRLDQGVLIPKTVVPGVYYLKMYDPKNTYVRIVICE